MTRTARVSSIAALLLGASLIALGGCSSREPGIPVTDEMKADALEAIARDEMPDFADWEMKETDEGIRFVELAAGSGRKAWYDDEVRVHYTLWLPDGTLVDSTRIDAVSRPFEFTVGDTRRVIASWHRIIQEMNVGSEMLAVVPWREGYGRSGRGNIPGRTDLIFRIRLLRIR